MKSFSILAIGAMLFLGNFGVVLSSSHNHHTDHCPFMIVREPCLMNSLEHANLFQKILIGLLPSLYLLLVVVIWHEYLPFIETRVRVGRVRRSAPRPPLFSELFSSGILNPKAP